MAGGWSTDGAVQDQIDATVEDAIRRARSELPHGESLGKCEECDSENVIYQEGCLICTDCGSSKCG